MARLMARYLLVAFVLGSFVCGVAPAAADDYKTCNIVTKSADDLIAACARLIDSGKLKGSNLVFAHNNRAIGFERKGDNKRAFADYEQALQLDPKYVGARMNRARLLTREGRHAEAIADLEEVLRLDPNMGPARTLLNMAWQEIKEGIEKLAQRAAQEAGAKEQPQTVAGRTDYETCSDGGPRKDERQACTRLIEAGQGGDRFLSLLHATRGIDSVEEDEWSKAHADFEAAIRYDRGNASFHLLRGIALRELDQKDRAKQALAEAKRLDPKMDDDQLNGDMLTEIIKVIWADLKKEAKRVEAQSKQPAKEADGDAPRPSRPAGADAIAWQLIQNTKDSNTLRNFVREFPDSPLRKEAEARIVVLTGKPAGAESGSQLPRFGAFKQKWMHDGGFRPPLRLETIAVSANGRLIAVAGEEQIALIDAETGKRVRNLWGHKKTVNAVGFLPDGRRLASASDDDATLRIWDLDSGRSIHVLDIDRGLFGARVAVSADGNLIAVASGRSITVWAADSGKRLQTINPASEGLFVFSIGTLTFAPDNGRLFVGGNLIRHGEGRGLSVWNVSDGKLITELPIKVVRSIAAVGQGDEVVVGYADGTIGVWNMKEKTPVRLFDAHEDEARSVFLSPDARWLLTAGVEETKEVDGNDVKVSSVKIWSLAANKLEYTAQSHTDEVVAVAIMPDGKGFLTATQDYVVKLWTVE